MWVEDAKLYTRPEILPLIIGAAVTPETAEWLGSWADGLITTSHPPEKLKKLSMRLVAVAEKGNQ